MNYFEAPENLIHRTGHMMNRRIRQPFPIVLALSTHFHDLKYYLIDTVAEFCERMIVENLSFSFTFDVRSKHFTRVFYRSNQFYATFQNTAWLGLWIKIWQTCSVKRKSLLIYGFWVSIKEGLIKLIHNLAQACGVRVKRLRQFNLDL